MSFESPFWNGTATMRIPLFLQFLIFLLSFYPRPVVCRQEGGTGDTCNASDDGTCASGRADAKHLCFPDGLCFKSIGEAEMHYGSSGSTSRSYIGMKVPREYGEAQEVGSTSTVKTLEVLAKTHDYMTDLFRNNTARSYRGGCHMRHESCAFWAAIGECEAVSLWMNLISVWRLWYACRSNSSYWHASSFSPDRRIDRSPLVWNS